MSSLGRCWVKKKRMPNTGVGMYKATGVGMYTATGVGMYTASQEKECRCPRDCK